MKPERILGIWAAVGLLAACSPRSVPHGPGWGGRPHMMPWSASNWMGSLMGIVIWLLIIVGAVFIVRWAMSSSRKGLAEHRPDVGEGGDEDPLNILRKRYARGEIDRETFERMKRELES